MSDLIWILLFVQVAMGGFDTLYHHELTERLAWRPSQARELRLHGARNLAYAVIFLALGWSRPQGALAVALIVLMLGELVLTLWDFVEEDRTRKLPASERVTHTLLTLNYGVVLALVIPLLTDWAAGPTALVPTFQGVWSVLCALAAAAVVVFGLRDLAAAGRARRIIAAAPAPLVAALPPRQSILVTGATGLIGRRLVAALVAAGHEVTALTRSRATAADLPAPIRIVTALDQIADDTRLDAVVNLAGEPISDGLWTPAKRRRIIASRLEVTRAVVRLIARLDHRPKVLVSGSAIGWYGLRGDEVLDETADGHDCFSRTVCRRWERAAMVAQDLGVRVVRLRIGIVLAIDGGALSRMLTPFEFCLGGPFGAGCHWMSWIHLDDLVRLIAHAIATPDLEGAVNGTAPEPARNAAFARALGRALNRPALLPAPAAPLRLALGAFADELLLQGQRIAPKAALASGFAFTYPTLDAALGDIVGAVRAARPAPVAPSVSARASQRRALGPA
ncbi:TIGR01777 family oxidoreductase [Caulobacter soli]|uniref:TIGR01777 family oxidoreductase n=1 Tax=Caulobacter soli TaxID=2708539 RepID=UPI0013ECE010|nr:TIGR01777 family oxidoreductase [Caulobacter soli]